MRVRIFISTGLLGVLAAFIGFAFDWIITAHSEVTYEMPGNPTSITVGIGGEEAAEKQGVPSPSQQLQEYLSSKDITLLISSTGDGLPRLVAYNPVNTLPWLDATSVTPGDVLLFEGTYSHRQWESTRGGPLLPNNSTVRGVIPAPEGAGNLQYVHMLADDTILPPGRYVVNTQDPEAINRLVSILAMSDLRIHESLNIPLSEFLLHDPLIGVTVTLFAFGLLATATHWVHLSRSRLPESHIRRQHGARTFDLTRHELVVRVSWIGLGAVAGACFAAATVAWVGRVPLTPSQWMFLAACWVTTVIVSVAVSAAGSYAAFRVPQELTDAA